MPFFYAIIAMLMISIPISAIVSSDRENKRILEKEKYVNELCMSKYNTLDELKVCKKILMDKK